MTMFLASASIVLAAQVASGQQPGSASSQEYAEPPACGHHEDIWGFSIDLPTGRCADTFLHGVALRLSEKDDAFERLIVVFAIGNVDFVRSAADVARAHVDAARDSALGPITILARSTAVVGATIGERWTYRYREKQSDRERDEGRGADPAA